MIQCCLTPGPPLPHRPGPNFPLSPHPPLGHCHLLCFLCPHPSLCSLPLAAAPHSDSLPSPLHHLLYGMQKALCPAHSICPRILMVSQNECKSEDSGTRLQGSNLALPLTSCVASANYFTSHACVPICKQGWYKHCLPETNAVRAHEFLCTKHLSHCLVHTKYSPSVGYSSPQASHPGLSSNTRGFACLPASQFSHSVTCARNAYPLLSSWQALLHFA